MSKRTGNVPKCNAARVTDVGALLKEMHGIGDGKGSGMIEKIASACVVLY